MENARIYKMKFASVYPLYVKKAERKGKTQAEVDEIICWLTGFSLEELQNEIAQETDFEHFFQKACLHKNASLIRGVICGHRVEEIEDALMQKIRYMDKLIDELAKGKSMDKILRK